MKLICSQQRKTIPEVYRTRRWAGEVISGLLLNLQQGRPVGHAVGKLTLGNDQVPDFHLARSGGFLH